MGDTLPWTETIKPSGVKWFHVMPSVCHALRAERAGMDAVIASYNGDEPNALMYGGEVTGRVDDIPPVKELVERTVQEAEEIIRNLPGKVLG